MGGSWIHHPVGNPMRVFAEQVGVACARAARRCPAWAASTCAEGRRLSPAEVEASVTLLYETFPSAVERLRTRLDPDASVAEAIDAFLGESELDPAAARRARQALRAVIEAEAADLPERQSLRWMWNEYEYEGDYFGDLPSAGATGVWLTRWPPASTYDSGSTWPRSSSRTTAFGYAAVTEASSTVRTSW